MMNFLFPFIEIIDVGVQIRSGIKDNGERICTSRIQKFMKCCNL